MKECKSHHHACRCREAQFTEAIKLLESMCHLSCAPQTPRYRSEYMSVKQRANDLIEKVEVHPHDFPSNP